MFPSNLPCVSSLLSDPLPDCLPGTRYLLFLPNWYSAFHLFFAGFYFQLSANYAAGKKNGHFQRCRAANPQQEDDERTYSNFPLCSDRVRRVEEEYSDDVLRQRTFWDAQGKECTAEGTTLAEWKTANAPVWEMYRTTVQSVKWESLTDSSGGPATLLPELLFNLLLQTDSISRGALVDVYSRVLSRQGQRACVYECGAAIVPFLFATLQLPTFRAKEQVLSLLSDMTLDPKALERATRKDDQAALQAHQAVASGAQTFVQLLNSPGADIKVRMNSSLLLAATSSKSASGERLAMLAPFLQGKQKLLRDSPQQELLACIAFVVGALAGAEEVALLASVLPPSAPAASSPPSASGSGAAAGNGPLSPRKGSGSGKSSGSTAHPQMVLLPGLAAALNIARVTSEQPALVNADLRNRVAEVLVRVIQHPDYLREPFSDLPWAEDDVTAHCCEALGQLDIKKVPVSLLITSSFGDYLTHSLNLVIMFPRPSREWHFFLLLSLF